MIRLLISVEGQTEETFARSLLAPYLLEYDVVVSSFCLNRKSTKQGLHKGGSANFQVLRRNLLRLLKEHRGSDVRFSTMFDLYALPDDFPGFSESRGIADPYARVQFLEDRLQSDIADPRFLPYLQLHEFEALVLSDLSFIELIYAPRNREEFEKLQQVCASKETPELIDDGKETAPSKRIAKVVPRYAFEKARVGPIITQMIGLPRLRNRCPHFGAWLSGLEAVGRRAPLSR